MNFDLSLPSVLFFLGVVTIFLYSKFEGKIASLFEEREFRVRDIALLVLMMGIMVSVVVFVPQMALMIVFLSVYSLLTFTFTYVVFPRWYVAILTPAAFLTLYFLLKETVLWSLYLLNFFAMVFAVLITIYLGKLFTWKATTAFAALLTGMDIVQVLLTRHMVTSYKKLSQLQLPIAIRVPAFPPIMRGDNLLFIGLGLGDLFFAGLLGLQAFRRFGVKTAIVSLVAISASFMLFEMAMLNYGWGSFPGTLMILCGWLPVVVASELQRKAGHENPARISQTL